MDFQQQSTFTSSHFEKIEKQNKKQNCKKIRLDEWTNKTCFDVLSFFSREWFSERGESRALNSKRKLSPESD